VIVLATSGAVDGILIGAVVAAFGYVGKEIVQSAKAWRAEAELRRVRLHQLEALLNASRAAFHAQRVQRDRLEERLRKRLHTDLPDRRGYERLFTHCYPRFDSEEKDLHTVIRAYTEHALRPLNEAMLTWLRNDVDHRTAHRKSGDEQKLSALLNQLDAHLLLWLAKYEAWIPNQPAHALVYLADEEEHGVGFPTGIEDVLAAVLSA
jgi:hypothetical protein